MLELKNLVFCYPDYEFDLSMNVPTGSRLVLQGPSGTGKTTVLNLIAGFLKPSAGDILWNNKSLIDKAIDQRPIAYLFQSHHVFDHLSAYDNVALGLYSHAPADRIRQRDHLKAVINDCELDNIIQQKTSSLSGGQKQRVALARFIVQNQPVGLLDEPFNGLDQQTKKLMMDVLIGWQQRTQATLIFTSHHQREIQDFATVAAYIDGDVNGVYKIKV